MRAIIAAASFAGTATVILACLRIADVITWSWWAVLAPLWVPAAYLLTGAAMVGAWVLLCTINRR